jgi:LuxR family transcriptional regulator, maltose regulon positive regulatory protein
MARTTPQVVNDRLTDHGGLESIAVGSPAWFTWLEQARVFTFRSTAGTFTARQERRERGGAYWRAYRTIRGRQHRAYLGRSADLTPARLWAAAVQLIADLPTQPPQDKPLPGAVTPAQATSPILTTKLYVPRPRDGHVARPQLLARLATGLRGALTLIAAPAGFGKTTLLADLLAAQSSERKVLGSELPVPERTQNLCAAWLSLDAGDNDPAVFLRYLIAALQGALGSAVGAMALVLIESPQPPPLSVVLTALINDLANVRLEASGLGFVDSSRPSGLQPPASSLILVLDDYHVIDTPAIHEALSFLLDHLPPALRLVIASREDPPLPLARLRGRGQLTELRAADLRFVPSEVAAFLNDVMHLDLSADAVAALDTRTEGWITGLQLAALAIQNHTHRDSFVGAFTGSNRFIVDYLASEVLDHLTAELRTFMLSTSILNRLCGPLCDAVLGMGDQGLGLRSELPTPGPRPLTPDAYSQRILDQLERANLFLIPLDAERRWYRYHQLFAEVLRERLARSLPATHIADLHERASIWFEQHQLAGEAIQHALAAQHFERAAGLIERIATPMSLDGQYVTVEGWLAQLPAGLFDTRPYLALAFAAVASLNSDYAAAEAYLQQADAGAQTWDTEQAAAVHREVAAHRALITSMRGDERAIELGRMALAQLPERHALRSVVVAGLGYAYFYVGNLAAADQILQENLDAQPIHGSQIVIGASLVALLAMVRRAQGRLRQVLRLSEEVLKRTTHGDRAMPLGGALLAYLLLGLTQCEQNNLDASEHTLRQCASLAGEYQVEMYELLAQFYLGQVLCARGDMVGALNLVERAAAAGAQYLSPLNMCEIEGYRAMLWLKQGDLASATGWAVRYEHAADGARPRFTAYDYDRFALARIYMAQGRLEAADAAVVRLLHAAEATDHGRYVIWALVLRALILQAQGDTVTALESIARALALAEPEGYVRVFVDEGAPMAELLVQVAHHHAPVAEYAARLLATFPSSELRVLSFEIDTEKQPTHNSKLITQNFLVEPLSERELEVLRLLAEGRDNAEIARALVVAVSTIKSHVNHIFGKLGVGNRLEAVLRARQLNLV